MDDLINRLEAIGALLEWEESYIWDQWCVDHCEEVLSPSDVIDSLPAAEPKRGRWRAHASDGVWFSCSECGILEKQIIGLWRYCPNCGARMEGVK